MGDRIASRGVWGRAALVAVVVGAGLAVGAAGADGVPRPASAHGARVSPAAATQTNLAPLGLSNPGGVVVDAAGNVYVADSSHRRVVELKKDGTQVTLGFTGLVDPENVAVDSDGHVYVSDPSGHQVLELPPGGTQIVRTPSGITAPYGLAVDAAGDLFVNDFYGTSVVEVPKGGTQVTLAFTGLTHPDGLAVSAAGDVFVADGSNARVVELPKGGTQTTLAFTGLQSATAVAVDATGNVFAVDGLAKHVVELPKVGAQAVVPFTGLGYPRRVGVDGAGDLFVTDSSHNQVLEHLVGGGQQTVLFTLGLGNAYAATADAAGNVFVADQDNDRIVEVPRGGELLTVGFTGLVNPQGVAVDHDGNLYALDVGNLRVVKLTPTDSQSVILSFFGSGFGSLPSAIAVDGDESVYVYVNGLSQHVTKLTKDGVQSTIALPGVVNATGLAVDVDHNLYVVDRDNNRIVVVSSTGVQSTRASFGLSSPFGIAVDPAGNAFVADTANNRVVELPKVGSQSTVGFTGILRPNGVAVDPDGDVFATSIGSTGGLVELSAQPVTRGLLRVVTSPAVPSQLTVDGVVADTWGLQWVKEPTGSHTVCFGAVPGYTAPACQTVTIAAGVTTTVTGAFARRGYLHVVTSPAVASQISVDGVPRDNWGLFTDLPAGSHTVCFGPVAGHTAPACQAATIGGGDTTTITGLFTGTTGPGSTGVGQLRVTTSPAVPSQITVDGAIADTWGLNWLEIPGGSHAVCFGHVEGYTEPGCQTVTVANGATTAVNGSFAVRGFLKVVTSPALPATITVNGTPADDWGVFTDLPVGSYQVCFGAVTGKAAPACQVGAVTVGSTTTVTGTYT